MKYAFIDPKIETRKPEPATSGSVGFDVYATSKTWVGLYEKDGKVCGNYFEYGTNLALEIPDGVTAFLIPRSSVRDKSLVLANGVGLPDRDYRGELKFSFKPDGRHSYHNEYEVGEHMGQIVFLLSADVSFDEPVSYEELSKTDRGTGGHGSTENISHAELAEDGSPIDKERELDKDEIKRQIGDQVAKHFDGEPLGDGTTAKELPTAPEGTVGTILGRSSQLVILATDDSEFQHILTDEDLGEYTPQTKFFISEGKLVKSPVVEVPKTDKPKKEKKEKAPKTSTISEADSDVQD